MAAVHSLIPLAAFNMDNCRPDLIQINLHGEEESPLKWLGHFWVDSLVHNDESFSYLIKTVGQNRIVLGTDFPFPLGECYPLKDCGQLVEQYEPFSAKDKKQVLWYNGLEFIGKEESAFLKKPETEPQVTEKVETTVNETKDIVQEKKPVSEDNKTESSDGKN